MKQLLPLLILLNCHMIQGDLEWIVSGKVTDYGQDVTLFCNVSNCCPNDAGWDRYSPEQRTLFIDVKTRHSNKKYDGKTLRDGYTLVIKNLTKNDLNVSYACVYGVTIGQSKFLWKEDVFTYISDTTPNPPNDNSRLSELQIAGITIGIVVLVVVAVAIFVLFLKKTRKKGHISEVEAMPLLDYFLEDPSNIECIEGEDATLTCKVRTGGPPVQWKKGSTAITSNANSLMRNEDTEHNLIIKNFKPSDSGEYTVEVGKFSKTIKLAIKDYFLEDPSNIECIEGKDATLTCKVRAGSPPVQWKKGSTAITSNENCLISNKDTEHNLILKNVKPSDSGEYCVEVGQFSKTIKLAIKDDEENILERKKHLHQMILNDERVKHYYARVMFIGKYGVGKTSLMRRLLGLGKHAAINTDSTDGVSISKCMINVQNGKWRPCDKTDDDLARLIKHVFAENKDKTKDNVAHKTKSNNTKREMMKDVADHQEKEQPEKSDLIKTPTKNVSSSIYEATNQTNQEAAMQDDINSKIDEHSEDQFDVNHTKELQRKELDNIDNEVNDSVSITSNSSTVLNEEFNITVDEELCQTTRKDDLNKMTSDIIDKYVQNSDASQPQKQEEFASCWLWDFAGQNDFYATHQAFLSSCAVYILVADSLEFSAEEKLWIDFENSAQYVRFWCDAVHCYCQTTDNKDMIDPAIVIVHTKKDARQTKSLQEDHHNAFVKKIGNVLLGQDQKKHIRDTLNVSNTKDGDDVFEHIRKRISALAMEMESWGVKIPLKWFLFQQVIEKLKENKVPISTTKKVQQMASHKDIGITDDDDFRKCLLYFHDVGTLIYYDEEGLNENVILDPKWLIDAFRCLVSHQISNETKIGDDWCTLQETGKITTSLLSKLLQKETDYTIDFHDNKDHLIEVMKKFDIIVNMIDSPDLYMPCMMKDCSLDFVKRNFITDTFDKTSWLCLRFDFLPPVFFNHIIARYMKIYKPSSSMDIIHALYRKIAVFDLPDSGCKQLILCQAPNILAVQICFPEGDPTKEYQKYREDLDQFVQNLKSRYKLNIMYKVEFACKDGDIERGRTNLCDLNEPEYRCKYHNNIHSSGDLLNWWYKKDESSTSYCATNLAGHKPFFFRVSAKNKIGFSEPSPVSDVIVTKDNHPSHRLSVDSDDVFGTTGTYIDNDSPISPFLPRAMQEEELPFTPRTVVPATEKIFEDHYEKIAEIGKGKFGNVYKCLHKTEKETWAAKVIKCRKKDEKLNVKNEISIMNELTHPKLIMLREAYETPKSMVLVMEYVGGGELFDRVADEDLGLTERDCVHFMRQICEGVRYMHEKSIMHLDLKPENILCVRKDSNLIKIKDFGSARRFTPGESLKVMSGIPEFIAPEVVNHEQIGLQTDIWSLGVICYVLLSGLSPFMGDSDGETLSNVTQGNFDFDDEAFEEISEEARHFIEKCLLNNMKKRITISQCIEHKWLAHSERNSSKKLRQSLRNLKQFMARRKWQKMGTAIRAIGRMSVWQKQRGDSKSIDHSSITSDSDIASQSDLSVLPVSRSTSRRETDFKGENLESSDTTETDEEVFNQSKDEDEDCEDDNCVNCENNNKHIETMSSGDTSAPAEIIKDMVDCEAVKGDDVRFDIAVEGHPTPHVEWLHDQSVIKEDSRHSFIASHNGLHSLIIRDICESDEGDYTCKVANDNGEDTCSAELIVYGVNAF